VTTILQTITSRATSYDNDPNRQELFKFILVSKRPDRMRCQSLTINGQPIRLIPDTREAA
jgi:hypothetical protein